MVEQWTFNPKVGSSNLPERTTPRITMDYVFPNGRAACNAAGHPYCRVVDWQYNSFIRCSMWVRIPPLQPFLLRVAQTVRAPGCGPGGRRFESAHAPHGALAQLVERQTEDLRVSGSIPEGPTTDGRMPESGQRERTVNPLALRLRWFKSSFPHHEKSHFCLLTKVTFFQ